jgi:hypothetical protein
VRSACLEWPCQTPCSYAGYMDVSTLHTFRINVTLQLLRSMYPSRSYWVSSDTGHRFGTSLRSARLPCQTPCSYARKSGCLYTSFDQDHDSVFFSFLSIKPAMLPASMLGDYSTSASSTPSCFPRRIDLLGNVFPITSLLDLLLLLFFFGPSYRPSCPP